MGFPVLLLWRSNYNSCVFEAFQLNPDPSSDIIRVPALPGSAQLSSVSESLGAFIFFPKFKNMRLNSNGCPTYISGRQTSLYHPTGFLLLLRHPWLHCLCALHRNI